MIKSMTGFGRSTFTALGKKFQFEIRSLNSKQFDLNLRVPSILRSKESEIRSIVSAMAQRGKIDVSLSGESEKEIPEIGINLGLAKAYYKEFEKLSKELGAKESDLFARVLQMPEVLKSNKEEARELNDEEWNELKALIEKGLDEFDSFRKKEGKSLEVELKNRISTIQTLLKELEPLDKKRFVLQKSRMRDLLLEKFKKSEVDENKFEQELFYYFEKLDITEEKLRLKTHCNYFLSTMKEDVQGRKLAFISQEIGREINTIGSKANDATLQKMVVQMKDELEKIKEQLMNVL